VGARLLAYITGTEDQDLLYTMSTWLRKTDLEGPAEGMPEVLTWRRSDARVPRERDNQDENFLTQIVAQQLREIRTVCRNTLNEVVTAALPDTILGWYRRLVAPGLGGSHARRVSDRQSVKTSRS
jgi:hypothetical protein